MALTATAARVSSAFTPASRVAPKAPALDPSAERTVVPAIATPAVASSRRLRRRAITGFGRLLRGMPQATFMTFCTAWATPRPP